MGMVVDTDKAEADDRDIDRMDIVRKEQVAYKGIVVHTDMGNKDIDSMVRDTLVCPVYLGISGSHSST